jgi:hypothetical protein
MTGRARLVPIEREIWVCEQQTAKSLLGVAKRVPGEGQESRQHDDAKKHGSHSHIARRSRQRDRLPIAAAATSGVNRLYGSARISTLFDARGTSSP